MTVKPQNFFLYLMRHGEALNTGRSGDHTRQLSHKGQTDCATIGAHIMADFAARDMFPREILASAATRTQETARYLALIPPPALHLSERLYHGDAQIYLDEIRLQDTPSLLLIGHNPAISHLLHLLCARQDARRIPQYFSPATLAVLEFAAPAYECAPYSGHLQAVLQP